MKRISWEILLGVTLIVASAGLYLLQIRIFHAERDTFFYLIQDLAFVPVQVLLVTLILDQLLNIRERRATLNKMNMVIGAFFSEAGSALLRSFSRCDRNVEKVRRELLVTAEWNNQRFALTAATIKTFDYHIDCTAGDLERLKAFLVAKRDFFLRLLENPNLLEHETFTELLWAVFHLTEELAVRDSLADLPDPDRAHLAGDIKRAHALLIVEWLAYMKHLKSDYPYLFSLAVRMNPFNPDASPEVKG